MKRSVRVAVAIGVVTISAVTIAGCATLQMPGNSYAGPARALTESETRAAADLRRVVDFLSITLGRRNAIDRAEQLHQAADFIENEFKALGYTPVRQSLRYDVELTGAQTPVHVKDVFHNIEAELPGSRPEAPMVLLGAHYDSAMHAPGADDNATGVAALLALAKTFAGTHPEVTIRFVAFVNEEPPWFNNHTTGAHYYARGVEDQHESLAVVMSLETLGYYSDAPDTQQFPFPLSLAYPSTGNFVAFVGNPDSVDALRTAVKTFRGHAVIPSYGAALPVAQAGWSDHAPFWRLGVPGFMITDTAPFRNPHYHQPTDLPDVLDFNRLAQVVTGLEFVVSEFANVERPNPVP